MPAPGCRPRRHGGSEAQRRDDKPVPGQQIIVRMRNGVRMSITQPVNPALRHGRRLDVEGRGQNARAVPR